MFEVKLKEIFSQYPGNLADRTRFLGLLRDYFPNNRLQTNLLMMAFDIGIHITIEKAVELDNIAFGRFVKILISNYGIGEDNAHWCVKTWFDAYGSYLGKKNSCSDDTAKPQSKKTTSSPKKPEQASQPIPTKRSVVFSKDKIDLSSYGDGQKLPKSILHRDIAIEKKFGLGDMNFTISKEHWYSESCNAIKLVGELYGSALNHDYTILVFTVYNDSGELIGTHFGERIRKEDFCGYYTLSITITVPKDEYISEIRLRPIIDPCFAE